MDLGKWLLYSVVAVVVAWAVALVPGLQPWVAPVSAMVVAALAVVVLPGLFKDG